MMIGIGRYPDGSGNRTVYHELSSVSAALAAKYHVPEDHSIMLVDEAATISNIIGALTTIRQKIRPEEHLFIFYSGKGDLRTASAGVEKYPYIIPYDTTSDPIVEIGLSVSVLLERIVEFPAAGAMLVLNAPLGGGTVISERLQLKDKHPLNQFLPPVGVLIAGLSERKLQAAEDDTLSVFVRSLLRGLNDGDANGDNILTASEWSRFVINDVSSSTRLRQNPQYSSYPKLKGDGARFRAPEPFLYQRTIISPNPEAVVYDGTTLLGRTPLNVRFSKDSYSVTVTASGFTETLIALHPVTTPETVSVSLMPASRLRVTTHPPGASVFLDDSLIGTTPLFAMKVPRASYRMGIRLDHHNQVERNVDLVEHTLVEIDERLERKTGFVSLTGPVGEASIAFEGSGTSYRADRLPQESMRLMQGQYTLSVAKPGYHAFERSLTVTDQTVSIPVFMEPKSRPFSITMATLMPGSGQIYMGRPLPGWPLLGGFLYTAGKAVASYNGYFRSNDDYLKYRSAYQQAGTPADLNAHYRAMTASYDDMKQHQRNFFLFSGIAAALTAVSIIDAVMFEPAPWGADGLTLRYSIP